MPEVSAHEKVKIKALVKSANENHRLIKEAARAYQAWLLPYVGQCIFKSSGGYIKELKDSAPAALGRVRVHYDRYAARIESDKSAGYTVDERGTKYEHAVRTSHALYVAEMRDGILIAMKDLTDVDTTHKSDFTAREVTEAYARAKELFARMNATLDAYSGLFTLVDHRGPDLIRGS